MAFDLTLTPVVNLLFCALIVIVGLVAYAKTRKETPLYLAAAFLLFGLAHFTTILGAGDAMTIPLLAVRVFGYIIVLGLIFKSYSRKEGA